MRATKFSYKKRLGMNGDVGEGDPTKQCKHIFKKEMVFSTVSFLNKLMKQKIYLTLKRLMLENAFLVYENVGNILKNV